MGGNELLQVDGTPAAGNRKEQNVVRSGRGVQNAVKDRLDQDKPEGFQEPDRGQQQHTRHQLQPKRKNIP